MKLLNLGCGGRFLSDWTNVDFVSQSKNVLSHNIGEGIPFKSDSFDFVYHSHLLEHFPKPMAGRFINDCFRVLKSGGTIRVATPDLEKLAIIYLKILDQAEAGSRTGDRLSELNYDWIMLHLLDQTVRNKPGGEMKSYLLNEQIENEEFVESLLGSEYKNIKSRAKKTTTEKLKTIYKQEGIVEAVKIISATLIKNTYLRDSIQRMILGKDYESLQIGRFRRSGEVHQWIYDRYSLGSLLKKCGFYDVQQYPADKSNLSDWSQYTLDTEPDGSIYRPDSIYVEGIKP